MDPSQLVYDADGKELRSDFGYYIFPANPSNGGGLTYVPSGLRCLNFVAQESGKALLGIPVSIKPRNASADPSIRQSSDVFIEFIEFNTFCAKRNDWHITSRQPRSSSGQHQYLAAGNEDGIKSFGLFRIEKHGANTAGYKLVACVDKTPCRDIGLFAYKDKTWLTISDNPFMVVFKNAN
ncbi:hypothetical protein QYE76_040128 [Lolium multiflorum]|uniref:Uncharacterized protein n=1 Tax=Lolium multiflorum TaxID=4521 RepID=A0AAD8TAM8_LOLMU|nr:hypothetical protein QYE76_040128 [Lolium multiflorum]